MLKIIFINKNISEWLHDFVVLINSLVISWQCVSQCVRCMMILAENLVNCERKQLWPSLIYQPSNLSEGLRRTSNQLMSKVRFESGTSWIWCKNANHLTGNIRWVTAMVTPPRLAFKEYFTWNAGGLTAILPNSLQFPLHSPLKYQDRSWLCILPHTLCVQYISCARIHHHTL